MKARKKKLKPVTYQVIGSQESDASSQHARWSETLVELHQLRTQFLAVQASTPSSYPDQNRSSPSETALPVQRLGSGFAYLPERLLRAYEADRKHSELANLFRLAHRIHERVDRVIVVGAGPSMAANRAIFDACAQPYWNELTRGQRGSRPRLYFVDETSDNDSVQGLLHLVQASRSECDFSQPHRWAIVVIDRFGKCPRTAALFELFQASFRSADNFDLPAFYRNVIPVTPPNSPLGNRLAELECTDFFAVGEEIEADFGAMSVECLIPAALLGLNVIEWLLGAAELTIRFRDDPIDQNPVIAFSAINVHWKRTSGLFAQWDSSTCHPSKELQLWFDRIRNPSAVPTVPVHRWCIDQPRFDRISTWPLLHQGQHLQDANPAGLQGRLHGCLQVHCMDELHLGQCFQLAMLSEALERLSEEMERLADTHHR